MRQILEQIARNSVEAIKLDPADGAGKGPFHGSIDRKEQMFCTRTLDVGILNPGCAKALLCVNPSLQKFITFLYRMQYVKKTFFFIQYQFEIRGLE